MNNRFKQNTTPQRTLLGSAVLMAALIVISQPSSANGNERGNNNHRAPPAEAFTACEGKSVGDISTFETPRGETITGICEEPRRGNTEGLVLRPDNQMSNSNSNRTPPAEAFTACEGKSEGEESQFEDRRGETLKGTCEEMDGQLVLRPARK